MRLKGLRILLAEDNATNQMVAVQMLEALGAEVSLAEDGVAALELAGRERFDLALIDIEMPRMSGTEVIRRLRAGPPPHCDMPLIALTAYVIGELRSEIDSAGADGVIAKPLLSVEGLEADILRLAELRRRIVAAPDAGARPGGTPRATPNAAAVGAPPDGSGPPPPPHRRFHAPEAPGVDARVFDALTAAVGPEAMPELIRKVLDDMASVRARLETGLARHDPASLRAATHVLVAVAGSIGAARLQYGAQCLNSAVHSGETTGMDALGRSVIEEIDVVTRFLSSKLRR